MPDESSTPPDVGVLSNGLLRTFQREMFAELARGGHDRLRPKHGAVLAHLDPEGTRAVDLAARSGAHKQVVTTLVDELEQLGYVTRVQDPSDRRAKLVVPTDLGRDQMVQAASIRDRIEQRYAREVGREAFEQFKETFASVLAAARRREP